MLVCVGPPWKNFTSYIVSLCVFISRRGRFAHENVLCAFDFGMVFFSQITSKRMPNNSLTRNG